LYKVFVINLKKIVFEIIEENDELTRGARIPKAQINPIFARNNLLKKFFFMVFLFFYLYDFLFESSRNSFGSIFTPRFGGSSTRSSRS